MPNDVSSLSCLIKRLWPADVTHIKFNHIHNHIQHWTKLHLEIHHDYYLADLADFNINR